MALFSVEISGEEVMKRMKEVVTVRVAPFDTADTELSSDNIFSDCGTDVKFT